MNSLPHLRKQSSLLANLRAQLREPSASKWTDAELYNCMNRALDTWVGRVSFPAVYTITNGWVASTYEYSLPWYIGTAIRPQEKPSGDDEWRDVIGWELWPGAASDGGNVLHIQAPETSSARVIFYAQNGSMPTEITTHTTTGVLTSSTTSVTVNNAAETDVGTVGYIYCEDTGPVREEWMQYAGPTVSGDDVTLPNLVRGLQGTTASAKASGVVVQWGVAAPRVDLFQQLIYASATFAHALFLSSAPANETEHHQWQMRFFDEKADMFWRRWTPRAMGMSIITPSGITRPFGQSNNHGEKVR